MTDRRLCELAPAKACASARAQRPAGGWAGSGGGGGGAAGGGGGGGGGGGRGIVARVAGSG